MSTAREGKDSYYARRRRRQRPTDALHRPAAEILGRVAGGEIVAQSTPEQVAASARSYTGAYLKPLLEKKSEAPERVAAD